MKKLSLVTIVSMLVIFSLVSVGLAATNAVPGTGWWSAELLQNVTGANASVTVTLYDSVSSNTYTKGPDTILPGEAKLYQPADFPTLPAGFQGSGVVSSTGDLRSLVSVTNRTTVGLGDPLSPQFAVASYQGTNTPGTTLNFPMVKNNVSAVQGNRSTTYFVQNAGSQSATATATFKINNLDYTYTTPSIGIGQMVVFSASDSRNSGNPPPAGAIGSLTVTSSQPLAGTVMEHKTTEAHATLLFSTRAFTQNDYDTFFYAPSIKSSYVNRSSSIYVQNVTGGVLANITVNYKGTAGSPSTCGGQNIQAIKTNLAAGQTWVFDAAASLPASCLAAAEITATGNIVVMVSEYFTDAYLNANPSIYQQGTFYSAFPAKSASKFWTLPLYKEDSNSKQTGAILQNVSTTTATNVVIKFIGKVNGVPTTYTTLPQTIPAGGSIVVFEARFKSNYFNGAQMTPAALGCVNTTAGCGANGLFALTISSDQNLVIVANESTYPIVTPRIIQDKNQYEGFPVIALP